MAERELGIVLRAKDLASRTIANVNRQLGNIGSNVSRGLSNAVRNVERGIAAAAVAFAGLSVLSLKHAGDLEAQMNTINTLIHATPEALGEIEGGIRKVARDTGTPLADLTAAYYDLISAGVKAADAQSVLETANRLAIGGLGTTTDGVNLLTTALNVYGGGAKEAQKYADYFAQSVAGGVVTIDEIAASFAQVGPMAQALGIDIQEVAAGYAQLTAKGETGAGAATAMAAALLALQRQTGPMEKAQRDLNVSFAQMADEKGLAYTYQQLVKYSHDYGVPLIDLVGRQEALAYAYDVSGDNAASYARQLDAVTHATDGQGVAQAQMSERQKGLNFQIARLKALATDAAITIGQRLLPMVIPMFEKLNTFLSQNQEAIGTFAENIASGFERAVKWAQSLDWSMIADSLKAAAGFSRTLAESFINMPSWIQVAVLSGWGLNKLTGGALGSILGGLRGSTPLTPMYTKEVGLGGGLTGGGPGGRVPGRGPGLLLGLTGVGLAAMLADEFEDEIEGFAEDTRNALLGEGNALINLPSGPSEWEWPFGSKNTPQWLIDLGGGPDIPPVTAVEAGQRPTPPRPTVAGGGYDPNVNQRDSRPDPTNNRFGLAELQGVIARIKAATSLPDTAMTPLTSAITDLTTVLRAGPPPGADYLKNGERGGFLGRPPGNFVPTVKLDPSQVTDIRGQESAIHELKAIFPPFFGGWRSDAAGITTQVAHLPPILERAHSTLQKVAGIGERQQGYLAAQSGKLAAIEGISNRIAGSSAISAAKNFSPTVNVPVQVDNHISIHEWQRTVQSSVRAYGPGAYTAV